MNWPAYRFSIRCLLAVVALVGLGLAGLRECQLRRERYHGLRIWNNVQTATARARSNGLDPIAFPAEAAFARVEVLHYGALAEKYWQAEQAPWWWVAADPPAPVGPTLDAPPQRGPSANFGR